MAQNLTLGSVQVFDTSISSLNQALRQVQVDLGMAGVVQVFDTSPGAFNLALAQIQAQLGGSLGVMQVGAMTVAGVNQALLQVVQAAQNM
jgi:hypothetical protein